MLLLEWQRDGRGKVGGIRDLVFVVVGERGILKGHGNRDKMMLFRTRYLVNIHV